MPTKKQQRRRQKLKRHEYEEVYVDETGRELDLEEAEELVGTALAGKPAKAAKPPPARRGARVIEPPSWRRTLRRGLLFAPLMFLTVHILDPEVAWGTKIFTTATLLAFFLPFSYFMDSMMYRSFQRRLGRAEDKKP